MGIPTLGIIGYLKDFARWVIDFMVGLFIGLIDWVVGLIPDNFKTTVETSWATFSPYFAAANEWIPLYECLTLVGLYLAFVVVFSVLKIVIKLIPFVG